jgi:hypothetical protein
MGYYVKVIRNGGTVTWLGKGREVLAPGAAAWYPHPSNADRAARSHEKKLNSREVQCVIVNTKDLE